MFPGCSERSFFSKNFSCVVASKSVKHVSNQMNALSLSLSKLGKIDIKHTKTQALLTLIPMLAVDQCLPEFLATRPAQVEITFLEQKLQQVQMKINQFCLRIATVKERRPIQWRIFSEGCLAHFLLTLSQRVAQKFYDLVLFIQFAQSGLENKAQESLLHVRLPGLSTEKEPYKDRKRAYASLSRIPISVSYLIWLVICRRSFGVALAYVVEMLR